MKKYKLVGYNDPLSLDEIRVLQDNNAYMPTHKEIIEIASGEQILDLGCGIGNVACDLSKKYPLSHITAVDYADYHIEVAKALYADRENLKFQLMNADNLDFEDARFNCVCFLEIIEHLDDPIRALKEIHRVLKPEGRLILSTNNVYYPRFFLRQVIYDLFHKKPKLMIHHQEKWGSQLFAWDLSTLTTLLKKNGFDYVSHFYVGSSGFFVKNTKFDKFLDYWFGKLFPFFKAVVTLELRKIDE